MENAKQVLHFQSRTGITTAQSNEHLRNWTEKGWLSANANGRIDRSRQHLNFEIKKGGIIQPIDKAKGIPQLMADRLKVLGITDPNKGLEEPRFRTLADFVISGSHDQLHRLAFEDQEVRFDFADANEGIADVEHNGVNAHLERKAGIEAWAKDMYDVLCNKYGEDNVLSFVVHCDERTPHIHAVVLPIIDGKLSYKQVFCGADKYEYRARTIALHDAFAEVNRKWGLERGDSYAVTHRKHRSTEEYRRELSGQCSTLEREVEEKAATLDNLNRQIHHAEIRIKGLQTMIANLEASRASVEREIDEVHQMLSSADADTTEQQTLMQREQSLQKKLDAILAKLADKRTKLDEADGKLADLQKQLAEAQARHDSLEEQIRTANGQVTQLMANKVGAEALWAVLREFAREYATMPPEVQARFEDTLIHDMAQGGMQIVACASLLTMGMIDNATNYAENCGGGGTRCDNDWGRDPDEDEHRWLRRCLAQSRKMIRPSARRIRR